MHKVPSHVPMGGIPTAALNNCMTFDSDMTFTSLSLSFLIYKMGIHLTGCWPKWAEREMGFEWEALTGSGSQALIKVGAPCR